MARAAWPQEWSGTAAGSVAAGGSVATGVVAAGAAAGSVAAGGAAAGSVVTSTGEQLSVLPWAGYGVREL